mgnify:CR=1 FL=1
MQHFRLIDHHDHRIQYGGFQPVAGFFQNDPGDTDVCRSLCGKYGGGIKVSRILLLLKGIGREISLALHPRSVKRVRMEGRTVETEVIRSVNAYLALYIDYFCGIGSDRFTG